MHLFYEISKKLIIQSKKFFIFLKANNYEFLLKISKKNQIYLFRIIFNIFITN